jgi:hypothetical protein
MIKVAMCTANGEVGYTISPADDGQYTDGATYGDYTARHIPYTSNDDDYIIGKYWDGGWQSRGDRPSEFHFWVNGAWALSTDALFNNIRLNRARFLAMSDWTQMPDVTFNAGVKAAWTTYRQALRDVPANNADVTSLDDVSWPTPPE